MMKHMGSLQNTAGLYEHSVTRAVPPGSSRTQAPKLDFALKDRLPQNCTCLQAHMSSVGTYVDRGDELCAGTRTRTHGRAAVATASAS